jgi:hypothetical protein
MGLSTPYRWYQKMRPPSSGSGLTGSSSFTSSSASGRGMTNVSVEERYCQI